MSADIKKLAVRSSILRSSLMIIGMIVSFFMMPFMIHKLGDFWYGILTLLQALTGYYYFVDMGLASAVTRYVTLYVSKNDNHNTNVIINTSLCIYLAMAFVIVAITMVVSYFAEYFVSDTSVLNIVRLIIIIMGMNLALEFPFKAFAGIMGAYMRYDLISYNQFLSLVIGTTLTYIFLTKGYGIIAIVVIGFGCSQLSNVIFYCIAKHIFPAMSLKKKYFKKEKVHTLFGYSVWSFIIQLGEQLRFRIDSFVIAWALSANHVTHFFIGANVANYFLNLIFRATNFLIPLFTKYFAENNYTQIREKLLLVTKINTILAVFGGGLIIIIGKAFLLRWVGKEYLDTYPILVVLTIAAVLEAIQNPSNNVLMAIAKHRYFAIVNITEGVSNLGLSIILVKHYGILGVALGTLIPLVISRLFVLPRYVTLAVGLPLSRYYLTIAKSAIIIILYLFGFYLIINNYLNIPDYGRLLALCVSALPLYLIIVIFVLLNKSERRLAISMIPDWVCKRIITHRKSG